MADLTKMIKVFSKIDDRLGNNPLLNSVRRGLTYITPLILIGSFALVFISLPIPAYQNMMNNIFGGQWPNIFRFLIDGTFNILSLLLVISISYSYASEYTERSNSNISPIIVAVVALASFIAISGINEDGFSLTGIGVAGIFIAMLVAVTAAKLFLKLSSIKWLRIQAFTDGASSTFNHAVTSIYPAALTVFAFAALHQALTAWFGIANIQDFFSSIVSQAFTSINSPFWSGMLFVLLVHIFWFFGMHGNNILEPVTVTIFALLANQAPGGLGQNQTAIFTKTFYDIFIGMGGCGSTFCLVCAILLTGKHQNQLRLAKMSLVPVVFNINELLVFGIPIVLNPIYLLPFIGVPIILTVVSYLVTYYGIVPLTQNVVEWTTPIFLSGYAATGSIRGSLLQLFNLILGTLCYIPFVRLAEGVSGARMKNNLNKVYEIFKQDEGRGKYSNLLNRRDDIGNIARFLTDDLVFDLKKNKVNLFYQPQVDYAGNVTGAEALLRWNHDSYGYIYPPLVIALAEEAKLIDELGYWILDTACGHLKSIYQQGFPDITVSVNISAVQLESDNFIPSLEQVMRKYQIRPDTLEIEITEQVALDNSPKALDRITAIRKLGVKLAMDDFGMGHSSLMYLKEYNFNTIKLDGSLVREILSNANCCNIISSIVYLGNSLNFSVIAEFVEQEEQREVLHTLGCNVYQGYLFSKAVPFVELVDFAKKAFCRKLRVTPKDKGEGSLGQ